MDRDSSSKRRGTETAAASGGGLGTSAVSGGGKGTVVVSGENGSGLESTGLSSPLLYMPTMSSNSTSIRKYFKPCSQAHIMVLLLNCTTEQ